jgi:hypothetical protein
VAPESCTDAARVALAVHRASGERLADFLAATDNGRLLTAARRERDIAWCAVPDRFPVTAAMRAGALRPA